MEKGYNYASSKEQNREELHAMWKSLTDPQERKRLKVKARREERRALIALDTGL